MTVYLVGAGPGDPELLTRRAARLLAAADVVIYDRLVATELLREARSDAILINVGKHPRDGSSSTDQATINELLISHGRVRDLVVRLKGGDPFLFGRGGEEYDALVAAGVECEIVPGVSSALAVPALAGVPVTHRGVSASVTIASGHEVGGGTDWRILGSLTGTVVLLMAVAHRGEIAAQMIDGGRDPNTPVAIIESGTAPNERRQLTTLEYLGEAVVRAPAVIVVGGVASRLNRLDMGHAQRSFDSSNWSEISDSLDRIGAVGTHSA